MKPKTPKNRKLKGEGNMMNNTNTNCLNCNAIVPQNTSFCASCGVNLQQQPPPSTMPNPYQQQQLQGEISVQSPGAHDTAIAPGKLFLMIAGTLYIILSFASILGSFTNLSNINYWLPFFGGEATRGMWHSYYTAVIIYAMYTLFMGIMGVKHRENFKKAKLLQWLVVGEVGFYFIMNLVVFSPLGANDILGGWTSWVSPIASSLGISGGVMIAIDIALFFIFFIGAGKNLSVYKKL